MPDLLLDPTPAPGSSPVGRGTLPRRLGSRWRGTAVVAVVVAVAAGPVSGCTATPAGSAPIPAPGSNSASAPPFDPFGNESGSKYLEYETTTADVSVLAPGTAIAGLEAHDALVTEGLAANSGGDRIYGSIDVARPTDVIPGDDKGQLAGWEVACTSGNNGRATVTEAPVEYGDALGGDRLPDNDYEGQPIPVGASVTRLTFQVSPEGVVPVCSINGAAVIAPALRGTVGGPLQIRMEPLAEGTVYSRDLTSAQGATAARISGLSGIGYVPNQWVPLSKFPTFALRGPSAQVTTADTITTTQNKVGVPGPG